MLIQNLILIYDANIDRISNKVLFGKKNVLNVLLGKKMSFLIKNNELLEKYCEIWDKVSTVTKKEKYKIKFYKIVSACIR